MMNKKLYMVIETFKNGDAEPVYRRFREQGRLAPAGLSVVSSWVHDTLDRCYQLMENRARHPKLEVSDLRVVSATSVLVMLNVTTPSQV